MSDVYLPFVQAVISTLQGINRVTGVYTSTVALSPDQFPYLVVNFERMPKNTKTSDMSEIIFMIQAFSRGSNSLSAFLDSAQIIRDVRARLHKSNLSVAGIDIVDIQENGAMGSLSENDGQTVQCYINFNATVE